MRLWRCEALGPWVIGAGCGKVVRELRVRTGLHEAGKGAGALAGGALWRVVDCFLRFCCASPPRLRVLPRLFPSVLHTTIFVVCVRRTASSSSNWLRWRDAAFLAPRIPSRPR